MDLAAIGFGKTPMEKTKEQGAFLAKAVLPYLREAIQTAHDGKVKWDPNRMEIAFAAIDALGPLIDEEDWEERDKFMLHGVLSGILRMRAGGLMNDRRLAIAFATLDVGVELYGQAGELLKLDVDRAPSEGSE